MFSLLNNLTAQSCVQQLKNNVIKTQAVLDFPENATEGQFLCGAQPISECMKMLRNINRTQTVELHLWKTGLCWFQATTGNFNTDFPPNLLSLSETTSLETFEILEQTSLWSVLKGNLVFAACTSQLNPFKSHKQKEAFTSLCLDVYRHWR